ncbi:hypothetical protein BGY98DRAFT_166761 [Russula aff. rugulosa BPL654]|nr:hypothetical protein BGY98DRAFT_166761 [Russula aff. rugulosa BPL654]
MHTRRRRICHQHARPLLIMHASCGSWLRKTYLDLNNKKHGKTDIPGVIVRRDSTQSSQQSTQPSVYPQQMLDDAQNTANMHHSYSYPISPTQSNVAASSQEPMQVDTSRSASVQATSAQTYGNSAYVQSPPVASQPQPTQSDDLRYWNNMFRDLGFGEAVDQNFPAQQNISSASAPSSHQSLPMTSSHHQTYGNGRGAGPPQQPYAYHHMHSNAPGYAQSLQKSP